MPSKKTPSRSSSPKKRAGSPAKRASSPAKKSPAPRTNARAASPAPAPRAPRAASPAPTPKIVYNTRSSGLNLLPAYEAAKKYINRKLSRGKNMKPADPLTRFVAWLLNVVILYLPYSLNFAIYWVILQLYPQSNIPAPGHLLSESAAASILNASIVPDMVLKIASRAEVFYVSEWGVLTIFFEIMLCTLAFNKMTVGLKIIDINNKDATFFLRLARAVIKQFVSFVPILGRFDMILCLFSGLSIADVLLGTTVVLRKSSRTSAVAAKYTSLLRNHNFIAFVTYFGFILFGLDVLLLMPGTNFIKEFIYNEYLNIKNVRDKNVSKFVSKALPWTLQYFPFPNFLGGSYMNVISKKKMY